MSATVLQLNVVCSLALLLPWLPLTRAAPSEQVKADTTLTFRNVTVCSQGFGYPASCPQFDDPDDLTKCCRHYDKPKCCQQRARKVCMNKDNGNYFVSAWDIDPTLDMDAIFCPGPDQSESFTSCGYTKNDMICFDKKLSLSLVWCTAAILFVLFPITFGVFVIWSIRAERLAAQLQDAENGITQQQIEERKEQKLQQEKERIKQATKDEAKRLRKQKADDKSKKDIGNSDMKSA